MLNTGEKALTSENRLLTTVAYRLNGKSTYAIEGSIFMAGATMQWIVEGLKLLSHAGESESIVKVCTTGSWRIPSSFIHRAWRSVLGS